MSLNKTDCICTASGWCEKHQCYKTPHQHELCQTRPDYFQLWEDGRGPGQWPRAASAHAADAQKKRRGLGDKLHDWLEQHGITEDRYRAVKELFGLPPTCNCAKRREWLNRVGEWLLSQKKEE